MYPGRGDVTERVEDESALGQAGMWQDQVPVLSTTLVAGSQQIEIEHAGRVGDGAGAAGFGLDRMQDGQQG